MNFRFKTTLTSLLLFFLCHPLAAEQSISGNFLGYRQICQKAATDAYFLQNFRSMGEYRVVVELDQGDAYAKYLTHVSPKFLEQLEQFRRLDSVGNPPLVNYPNLGNLSPSTVRYIVFANQMQKLFSLPKNPKIVEIGAGFGGQCYILSCLFPSFHYYIYDLPEVEALITKMMETLNVPNVLCVPYHSEVPEERVDLLISNYALSECDRDIQLSYFNKAVKKADRGYIIFNQIAQDVYNVNSLTVNEFVQLLKNNGIFPKVLREIPSSAPGNVLIVWDKTKVQK